MILWDQQAYFIVSCGPNPTSVSGNFMGNVWCLGHRDATQSKEQIWGSVEKGAQAPGAGTGAL